MNTPTPKGHAIRVTSRTAFCGGIYYHTGDRPEHAEVIADETGIIADEIRQRLGAFRPLTFWRSESGRLDYVELPEAEKGGEK